MNSVIVFCMTTETYKNRIDAIKKTWFNDIDTIFYSDHEDEYTIKVSNEKDYKSSVIKQVEILKMINSLNEIKGYSLNEYTWAFFVDDDTFINTNNLNKVLSSLDSKSIYGQKFELKENIYMHGQKNKFVLSGGAGILISINNIKNIKNFEYPEKAQHSDLAACIIFENSGFNIENLEGLNHTGDLIINDMLCIKDLITVHQIAPKKFIDLYNISRP